MKGSRPLPYHSLLQLLVTAVLEDGQPVVKGDNHEGGERHSLVIPYQAPLVRRDRDRQAGGEGPKQPYC